MSLADKIGDELPPEEGVQAKQAARPSSVGDVSPFRTGNALETARVCDLIGIAHDGKFAICPGCSESGAAIALEKPGLKCLHARCSSRGKRGYRTNVDLVAEVKNCTAVEALNWLAEQFGFAGVRQTPTQERSAPQPKAEEARIVWIRSPELAEVLPPIPWRVRGLQLCPGRPAMIAAYASTAKTLTGQDLLVAYASGGKVFGEFSTGAGGVARHWDYDQGRYASTRRYQRIALGRGIALADLGDRLALASFPPAYLNMPNAVDVYARESEGVDLVLLDALRGATPGEDENDSKIRYCVDNLTRVNEKTGTAFVLIHHAGKPKEGHTDARTIARGSSAIFDACGCVLVMVGAEKGAPKLVSQQKTPAEAEGGGIDDFYLEIEDVADGANPTAGLRVVYRSTEQVNPPRKPDDKFNKLKNAIVELIKGNSDLPGLNAVYARTTGQGLGNKSALKQALEELTRDGVIAQPGGEGSPYRVL